MCTPTSEHRKIEGGGVVGGQSPTPRFGFSRDPPLSSSVFPFFPQDLLLCWFFLLMLLRQWNKHRFWGPSYGLQQNDDCLQPNLFIFLLLWAVVLSVKQEKPCHTIGIYKRTHTHKSPNTPLQNLYKPLGSHCKTEPRQNIANLLQPPPPTHYNTPLQHTTTTHRYNTPLHNTPLHNTPLHNTPLHNTLLQNLYKPTQSRKPLQDLTNITQ